MSVMQHGMDGCSEAHAHARACVFLCVCVWLSDCVTLCVLRATCFVDNWTACQATWQYLEPIFGSADIMMQMPEESEAFTIVDDRWRQLMADAAANPLCTSIGASQDKVRR